MPVHSWGNKLFQGWLSKALLMKCYQFWLHLSSCVSHVYLPFYVRRVLLCVLKFSPCSIWDIIIENNIQKLCARSGVFHRVGRSKPCGNSLLCFLALESRIKPCCLFHGTKRNKKKCKKLCESVSPTTAVHCSLQSKQFWYKSMTPALELGMCSWWRTVLSLSIFPAFQTNSF